MKFPLFFVSRCKSQSPVMTDPLYLRVESYASTKLGKGKNAKDALSSLPCSHVGKLPVFKHHILQGKDLKHYYGQRKLDLSNQHLSPSDVFSLKDRFHRGLKKVNLSGCGLTQFPRGLDVCVRLKELNLSNNPLGDSNISFFLESIHENTHGLKKLNLSGCGLKQFHLDSRFWELEELDLSNNPLGDSNISSFLASIHQHTHRLKKLNLSGCGLKQFHWDSHFWELEELDLSNNPLGDSSMGTTLLQKSEQKSILHLCPMIWLKKLNLSDCGFKTWPHVVHHPLNLEELNLSNNSINHQHIFENLPGSLSLQKSNEPLELEPIGLGFFVAKRIIFEDAVYVQTNGGRSFE